MTEELTAPRLLVVDDERHLATGLKLNFEFEGYDVDIAGTAREAMRHLAKGEPYEVIVLDVSLPDTSGFELCKRLRKAGDYTPVIMLTARNRPTDRVEGLHSGADDYLTKPFELDELLARVRSLLRRRRWEQEVQQRTPTSQYQFANVLVDFDRHEVMVGEEPRHLTQLELDLLRYFSLNPGRVIRRNELLEQVWKLRNYPNTRTVDNFVLRLRRHFEPDPGRPVHFLSIRGAGYKFEPEGATT